MWRKLLAHTIRDSADTTLINVRVNTRNLHNNVAFGIEMLSFMFKNMKLIFPMSNATLLCTDVKICIWIVSNMVKKTSSVATD